MVNSKKERKEHSRGLGNKNQRKNKVTVNKSQNHSFLPGSLTQELAEMVQSKQETKPTCPHWCVAEQDAIGLSSEEGSEIRKRSAL